MFVNVRNEMSIAREEIFGPVLSILTYDSDEEAIDMANDTVFGLHAYVMSSDPARAKAMATRLQAGRVMINTLPHDPLAPFGGYKQWALGASTACLVWNASRTRLTNYEILTPHTEFLTGP